MQTNITTKTKHILNLCYLSIAFASAGVALPIYASDTPVIASSESVTVGTGSTGSDLFTAGGDIMEGLGTKLTDFYTQKAFWPLLVINLVLLAFTKNEKRIDLYKKSLFIIAIVYALCKCKSVVTSTIDTLLAMGGLS